MFKFSTSEALQIVKRAAQVRRSRCRYAAGVKLAKLLDKRAMEKRGAIITIPVLLAAGLSAAAAAGVQWLIMRGEPEKAQELVKTELAKLKTDVKADYAEKMKTMQPRVYMATPKQRQQPPTAPQLNFQSLSEPAQSVQPPKPYAGPMPQPPFEEAKKERELSTVGSSMQAPYAALMQKSPLEELFKSLSTNSTMPWGQPSSSKYPPWLNQDSYKLNTPTMQSINPFEEMMKLTRKRSSASSMTKSAGIENALMVFIRPIMQKLIAGGAKITPQAIKSLGSRAGGAAARGIGAGAAGSKWALGKLVQKLPTQFLKGTGSRMAASTKPYFGAGVAQPYMGTMARGGLTGAAREQLGRGIAGRTAGGVGRAVSTIGTFGLIDEALQASLGGGDIQMPEGMSDDDMMRAQHLMSWLEATKGGKYGAQSQYLPHVDPALASKLPGFDLTEVPMGASDESYKSTDQAGLPQV